MENKIEARKILDSKGNSTIEVKLKTDFGIFRASAPSGTSKGKYEALELRDKDGRGVSKAIENIEKIIAPALKKENLANQKIIDEILIKLDGTKNKSRLGANALLAVSMVVCRAGGAAKNLSLWQYIGWIYDTKYQTLNTKYQIPSPCFNILNGGAHVKNGLDIQEFMIVPEGRSFKEKLDKGKKIYRTLGLILKKKYGKSGIRLGLEGGFSPPLKKTEEALGIITEAVEKSGFKNKAKLILDAAGSSFYRQGLYFFEGKKLKTKELLNFYSQLIKKYPIIGIEDPFSQDDWGGWQVLMSNVKGQMSKLLVIGDDLLATNPERMKMAKRKNACNGAIIKPNQIGTVSETIESVKLAKSFGWKIMVSHRSGETLDDFISDLAVGVGADFIKAGAPGPKERMAKYNRLVKIEKELCLN